MKRFIHLFALGTVLAGSVQAQQLTVNVTYQFTGSNGVDKVSRSTSRVMCLKTEADINAAVLAVAREAVGPAVTAPPTNALPKGYPRTLGWD